MDDEKKEKIDLNQVFKLKRAAFPDEAKNITDFPLPDDEPYEERQLCGKDRRKKCDSFRMNMYYQCSVDDWEYHKVDVKPYIVQLTMKMGGRFYVGTATIIKIVAKTLYLLTCAHNVIEFYTTINDDENQITRATDVWFTFNGEKISAKKFHVFGKYCETKRHGNDLAVIECELNPPFMFYTIFPALAEKNVDKDKDILTRYSFEKKNSRFDIVFCSDINKSAMMSEIYGYPGEKAGTFWGMNGMMKCKTNKNIISYNIDTTGGQSGSPIFSHGHIVGVHTNGGKRENFGTMLDKERIMWIHHLIRNFI